VADLNERRGTLAGLQDVAEVHTGVRPLLLERFRLRGVWTLGERSVLGADTMLPGRAVDGFVVGGSAVGASGPEDPARWGRALFADWAHRVTVLVPAPAVPPPSRRVLAELLERERPAHVGVHLCVAEASARVGLQARVGVDALVAAPGAGRPLDGRARLGVDARAAPAPDGAGAAGVSRVGVDVRIG
jgi:hypothetical protein